MPVDRGVEHRVLAELRIQRDDVGVRIADGLLIAPVALCLRDGGQGGGKREERSSGFFGGHRRDCISFRNRVGRIEMDAAHPHRHHRRTARPRPGPARRRYGALRAARRQPECARGVARLSGRGLGQHPVEQKEAAPKAIRTRSTFPDCRRERSLATRRHRADQDSCRSSSAAITRSRSAPSAASPATSTRGESIGRSGSTPMPTRNSSPSGNIHGMPLACILGMGPRRSPTSPAFARW